MKVDAVRNLNVVHNYNFGAKEKVEKGSGTDIRRNSSMMTKVPVIVLLAMNPATLNSAIPAQTEKDNSNAIVMLTAAKPAKRTYYSIIHEIEDSQQSSAPFGWRYFKYGQVQYSGKATIDDYKIMDIVYYNPARGDNAVTEIFVVDPKIKASPKIIAHPPKIIKIIYHDLGENREYCSVLTQGSLLNNEGHPIADAFREMKIDDDTANKILALTLDKTEWKNSTNIVFETTTKPEMSEPKIKYY